MYVWIYLTVFEEKNKIYIYYLLLGPFNMLLNIQVQNKQQNTFSWEKLMNLL